MSTSQSKPIDEPYLFGLLMDQLPDAIYFKDPQGRYLRVNRVLAGWYGLKDPSDAVGKTVFDFFPKAFAQAVTEAEQEILKHGTPVLDQEEKVVGPDGKNRWVLTTKLPMRDASGAIIGTFGLSRDLKHQKHAEQKVRDSEALYQSLIECLPQCIFRKDVDGRYLYVNQRLCASMNKTPKDLLGKTDYDVNPTALADKYRADDKWVMQNQKTLETTEQYRPKGKRRAVTIHVAKTPVYDSQGRVVGVQGIFWPEASKPAR